MATQPTTSKDSKTMQPTPSKIDASKDKNGNKPAPGPVPTAAKPADAKQRTFTDEDPSGAVAKPAEDKEEHGPKLSKEEKRALFDAIFSAEKDVKLAEDNVRAKSAVRTQKVAELIEKMGGKLGPWRVDGVVLRARKRGDSAYLLRPDEADIENI